MTGYFCDIDVYMGKPFYGTSETGLGTAQCVYERWIIVTTILPLGSLISCMAVGQLAAIGEVSLRH